MGPKGLEDFIGSALRGGWEMFDKLDPAIAENIKVQQELSKEEAHAISRAWSDFYGTPGGRKALDLLAAQTLGRTVFFVNLGQDIQTMAVFGAFREGQNALAQEIVRHVHAGRNETVKPRDVAKEL